MAAERLGARALLALAASAPRLNPQKSFQPYTGPFNPLGVDYYASTGATCEQPRATLLAPSTCAHTLSVSAALRAFRPAGFTGLFGVVLSFVCLAVPVCWLLFLLCRTCFRACCHCCLARAPPRAPSRARMLLSHCSAALVGAACVAGAACVWAAGPKLRAVLRAVVALGVEQTQLMLAQARAVIAVLRRVTPALQSAGASTADIADAAATLQDAADAVGAALNDNEGTIQDGLNRLAVATSVLGAMLIALVLLAWLGHALAPRRAARHFIGAPRCMKCCSCAHLAASHSPCAS